MRKEQRSILTLHEIVLAEYTNASCFFRLFQKLVTVYSKLDHPILIAGFSGPGMVGSIGANYIVEQMHMRQISYVESEFIMPTVIYIGGNLRHSFRIYANDVGNVCVLVCEILVKSVGIYSVLNIVVKWAQNVGVRQTYPC